MFTAALLVAALAPVQDPPARIIEPISDFVLGLAGNEVVLRSDLEIMISLDEGLGTRYQAGGPEERQQIMLEALSRRIETLVQVQAGEDLGYDPALVNELTQASFDSEIERFGGHRLASEMFARESMTPDQFKDQLRDRLLASTWARSKIGRAPGPIGRLSVDRYVRPGLMRMYYDSFLNSPSRDEREAVGRKDEQMRLQLLQVSVPVGVNREETRVQVQVFIDLYKSGDAEFDYFVETYGDESQRANRGLRAPAPAQTFFLWGQDRHQSEALGELAADGEVGDITDPLWLVTHDDLGQVQIRAWCVYRLAERMPAVDALPFIDRDLQIGMERYLLRIRDERGEDAAFAAALRDTHIWIQIGEDVMPENLAKDLILRARAQKRAR